MYAGDLERARTIYLAGLNVSEEDAAKWRKAVRADFAYLSERNLRHPLMAEIERDMGK